MGMPRVIKALLYSSTRPSGSKNSEKVFGSIGVFVAPVFPPIQGQFLFGEGVFISPKTFAVKRS